MEKNQIIKQFIYSLTIILLSVANVYAQKNNDNKKQNYLKYYSNSYDSARIKFIETSQILKKKYPASKMFQIKVPSKTDNNLFVDILYLPSLKEKNKLFILSSGVHGIEGHVGSAIQQMFIDRFICDSLLEETGVLLIHSVNPYGYKYDRRFSENNVDINRNSSIVDTLYNIVNEGYPKVNDFINPTKKVNTRSLGNIFFAPKAIMKILKASMPVLRQAILQGQYQYPDGLYYGGNKLEPQTASLIPILTSVCEPYKTVFEIDLHTGYGERGKLHFFPNPVDSVTQKKIETIFKEERIDWGDSDGFYTVTGDFVGFIWQINKNKTFIPMAFEYGTLNTQKTSGSLKSIHIMILENEGYHYGYKKERDRIKVKNDILEMYYPSSEEWRIKIMKKTEDVYKKILPIYFNNDF
ncbi:MAG: DUF2817 domain-containing protein [Chlorobi bacterium]|nr:DUF2817 domain-containing protein [Chlorobiota bacterium]